MWWMVAVVDTAYSATMTQNAHTARRVVSRSWRSVMEGQKPRTMFSEKVTEGASSVPEAVLMITEISAPKNTTCAANGM